MWLICTVNGTGGDEFTKEKDTHLARLRKSVEDGCIDGDRNRLFDG